MELTRIQIVSALGAVALVLLVFELVRRRKLSEEYSFVWVGATVLMAVLGFSVPFLTAITRSLGILYESSLVFAAGILFATVMLLHQSVKLSRLAREQRLVVHELALLRHALEEAKGQRMPGRAGDRA